MVDLSTRTTTCATLSIVPGNDCRSNLWRNAARLLGVTTSHDGCKPNLDCFSNIRFVYAAIFCAAANIADQLGLLGTAL